MEESWHRQESMSSGGLARGIDGMGHRGALMEEGENVCSSGLWCGYLLPERTYWSVYGYSGAGRWDLV